LTADSPIVGEYVGIALSPLAVRRGEDEAPMMGEVGRDAKAEEEAKNWVMGENSDVYVGSIMDI
jgi:hypothetical protein